MIPEGIVSSLKQSIGDIAIKGVRIPLRPDCWPAQVNGHLPEHPGTVTGLDIYKARMHSCNQQNTGMIALEGQRINGHNIAIIAIQVPLL